MKPVPTDVQPTASAAAPPAPHPHECLSALADGEQQALQAACSLWRDDEDARRAWHSYHLIGDVMRSEDLAVRPQRDADFLAGVRARLAAEPVVLAPPAAGAQERRRRQPWLLPAAAAAGVAVVAGVLVVTRMGSPDAAPGGPVMATAPGAASQQLQTVSVDSQGVLRDPRLEELVRQHHASRGVLAVPVPGTLRPQSVSVDR
jgi:sigma-E factor negative regulatory protein RseA